MSEPNHTLAPDPDRLTSLNNKILLLRDRITAVAHGLHTGLYVHGRGGIGKSHTAIHQLEALGAKYRLFNSRMTAKGLYLALAESPDSVFILEDMERLTKDRDAQGVLRSALWAINGRQRVVTWTTATDGQQSFPFTGGVILLANSPLAALPELEALATRITVYHLEASDAEILALMHELVSGGYRERDKLLLSPEVCLEIACHLLAECRASGAAVNLRLLFSSYQDYRQWEAGNSNHHWHDLVASRVREGAARFAHEPETDSAEEKKRRCRGVVREIVALTQDSKERVKLYYERTGRSKADFYRKLGEVQSGEFDPEASDR